MGPRGLNHENTLLGVVLSPWHSGVFLTSVGRKQQLSCRFLQSWAVWALRRLLERSPRFLPGNALPPGPVFVHSSGAGHRLVALPAAQGLPWDCRSELVRGLGGLPSRGKQRMCGVGAR